MVAREKKMQGKFPSGLQASMRQCGKDSGFGSEPNLGTQRFVPEFRNNLRPPHFSCGKSSRVRSRRGARIEPASPNRLDLQNSGASCYRSDTTGVVVLLGLTPGSRRRMVLCHAPAGAAHGSDSIDKLATLFPPFRTIRNKYGTECEACQGLFSAGLEQSSLNRPVGHPLPPKVAGEGSSMAIALSRFFQRERVPEGRVRGPAHERDPTQGT
jgi:hypothetical protein